MREGIKDVQAPYPEMQTFSVFFDEASPFDLARVSLRVIGRTGLVHSYADNALGFICSGCYFSACSLFALKWPNLTIR